MWKLSICISGGKVWTITQQFFWKMPLYVSLITQLNWSVVWSPKKQHTNAHIKKFRWKMTFLQNIAMIVTNPVLPVKYLALSRKPNAQCNACFGIPRSWAALFFKTKTAKLKWYFSVNSKPLGKIDSFEIWKWLGLFDVEDQIMAFCPIPRNKKVKLSWKMFAT